MPHCVACRSPAKGGLAQLGEHLLCKQGVVGSIPSSSTTPWAEAGIRNQVSASRGLIRDPWMHGCWIFNNQEEVRWCHPGRGGTWVVIASSRSPSLNRRGEVREVLWLLVCKRGLWGTGAYR